MRPIRFGSLHNAVLADEDRRMLTRLIQRALELVQSNDEKEVAQAESIAVDAFEDIIARGRPLTDKQRAWVKGVYDRVFDDPQYLNLASSGRLCRGREVELPKVLLPQNLPKKPPTRRRSDAEE